MNQTQIEENITLEQALRRANLLTAASEVSQNITQILDIDTLLPKTVDIICDAYDFYYAGVFLIDEAGEFAVLSAGRDEPGRIMIENNHKLAVGGNSMIGACTALNEARISLDVDTEKVWYPNPVLPETRSEMALPLAIGSQVIGAVTVQSVEAAAFSEEDISSLQAMANQLAIALQNAQQRRELEETHAELVQAKTFEAIATATGDAIHWIGNKAEPINGSVERIRSDVKLLLVGAADALQNQEAPNSLAQLMQKEAAALLKAEPALANDVERLQTLKPDKLQKRFNINSILDDLQIVQEAAGLIMKVKEDLIGPAREQAPRPAMIDDVLKDAVVGLNLPAELVTIESAASLPLVKIDPVQMNRVFVNLLKNAREATEEQAEPHIKITLRSDNESGEIEITVADNGPGIPAQDMDKIWITFHTTKGIKGHSGLGLPACRLILEQVGGTISAQNNAAGGAKFTVTLPPANDKPIVTTVKGKANILLVDDHDSWSNFAASTLSQAGFKVTTTEPEQALQNNGPFDLIIVDDILAGGDSSAILQGLKAQNRIGKVLMFSSNPRVEQTKSRMLLGVKNLLPKPYTKAALLNEISQGLD